MKQAHRPAGVSVRDWFWLHVDKCGPVHPVVKTRCWIWTRATTWGYGVLWFRGRLEKAHRVAWILKYGRIQRGKWVLHRCDNPPCVRWSHLFLGTHRDNMADANRKGRTAKGERHPTAKLTEAQVRAIRAAADPYALGRAFGITNCPIHRIIHRMTWKHVK